MTERCPFCGSEEKLDAGSKVAFECGSYYSGPAGWAILLRNDLCYERQIADLKERLEAWRELYQIRQELYFTELNSKKETDELINNYMCAQKKLKDLGEI